MKKKPQLRRPTLLAAFITLAAGFTMRALAADQSLAGLAYVSHHVDAGAVVIDTSGTAKLRITFLTPTMARVVVDPAGIFLPNPSPAVAGVMPPLTDIAVISQGDQLVIKSAGLSLHVPKAHLRVDAFDADDQHPLSLESPDDGTSWDPDTGHIRQSRLLDAAEHIYGLGEDNANRGTLDRRGTVRDLWTGQQIRSGNVTANFPVPFYLSTGPQGRGHGCFVDNVWHLRFDLGKTHSDRLTWTAPGGPMDYYLINGPSFKAVIDQYTRLTGRPTMLPLYAFGYWQSRCFFNNFADIRHTVDRLAAGGLPLDVLVIDSAWSKANMDFKWSEGFQSGRPAEEWIAGLHAHGAKVMLSTKGPMIRTDSDNYQEALSKGLFATDGEGKTMTTGYYGGELMDFTHPGMADWLATQLKPLSRQGIDCWWLDLIEPEGEPPQAVYHAGKSADIHNTFPLLNYRAYFACQRRLEPAGRPVILGRAASAGTQRYSGIVWTGDINSDWPTFQAHIPEVQNSGLSGLPYWANDSGGFISGFLKNDRYGAHAELYERWFEFTCFAPIARAHKSGPAEPYEFGPEVEATAKKYLQLRYRLLPYIYNLAQETAATGLPMVRPLVLEYQNDPASANARNEYLLGRDLLVAPVIWANTTARQVYFPPGRWISYDSHEEGFETPGGRTIGVAAPRDHLPLFVRSGSILPTAPDMMSTSEKPWDPVTLEIWPDGDSTGSLYQDDGITTAFTKGESTTTTFHCVEQAGKSVTFGIAPSNQKFGPRQWIARFHLTSVPTAVKLDDQTLAADESASPGWAFDATRSLLAVRLPGGRAAHRLVIALDGTAHPRPPAPEVDAPDQGFTAAVDPRQIAQFLPPPQLPVRIEAANFDKGGEGLAFHIRHPATNSVYRQEGVPIINSTDAGGGYAIPGLQAGDWLAYTLDANEGGWFAVSARVLPATNGTLIWSREGSRELTGMEIPPPASTGEKWISVTGQTAFYLPPGEQILTARVGQPGFQLGRFTFTKIKASVTVEAETGTMIGVSFNNDHPGFQGSGFVAGIGRRASSVRLVVKVPVAGKYLLALRYANGAGDAELAITLPDDRHLTVALPGTDGWDNYSEAGVLAELKAGNNDILVSGTDVGFANLDQLKLFP